MGRHVWGQSHGTTSFQERDPGDYSGRHRCLDGDDWFWRQPKPVVGVCDARGGGRPVYRYTDGLEAGTVVAELLGWANP